MIEKMTNYLNEAYGVCFYLFFRAPKTNKDFGELKISYVVTQNKEIISELLTKPSQTLQKLQKNPSNATMMTSNTRVTGANPVKAPANIFDALSASARRTKNATPLKDFLKTAKPKDVNIVDSTSQSALHIACLVCEARNC